MTTVNKKQWPTRLTKGFLQEAYGNQMAEATIRENINLIITETRKTEPGKRRRYQLLRVCEVKEFISTYGAPLGYEVPAEFLE